MRPYASTPLSPNHSPTTPQPLPDYAPSQNNAKALSTPRCEVSKAETPKSFNCKGLNALNCHQRPNAPTTPQLRPKDVNAPTPHPLYIGVGRWGVTFGRRVSMKDSDQQSAQTMTPKHLRNALTLALAGLSMRINRLTPDATAERAARRGHRDAPPCLGSP